MTRSVLATLVLYSSVSLARAARGLACVAVCTQAVAEAGFVVSSRLIAADWTRWFGSSVNSATDE